MIGALGCSLEVLRILNVFMNQVMVFDPVESVGVVVPIRSWRAILLARVVSSRHCHCVDRQVRYSGESLE